ncbi:MAG TPA: hypothetical protein VFR04_02890 [Solirubrobacterales bacterium]|nr:hypothetical protein [Solirubrobacterales bacterium]
MSPGAPHRLLAIVTDTLVGAEPAEEVRRQGNGGGVEVRVVVPAVEANAFRHTLGDIDEPKREAEERLRSSLEALRRAGVSASGYVGDPDPVQAAQDALLEQPADEVLIFEHTEGQARWFEDGLFEKARETLEPPLRMVVIDADEDATHVVEVESVGAGTTPPDHGDEIGSAYFPGLSRSDLAGMTIGVVGTIVTIVLAAAVASGPGPEAGWKAVAIGIAIFTALINMAHVVGLTLFESVHYRGGFAKFFRTLALVGTSGAMLANLLILLFA